MPKGPGTYGSKRGRPSKKRKELKKGGPAGNLPKKNKKSAKPLNFKKKIKSV